MENFTSLSDLMEAIPDEAAARAFMEKIIWGDTPMCPHCYNQEAYKLKDGKTYKCKNKQCQKTFTVTVGTIFEKTHIKLRKWVLAIYLCTVHKRGISSYQLATDIHVTQKTAWFMLHRIRKLFLDKAHDLLTGEIQIDETFVGGKNKNRHHDKKYQYSDGRRFQDKTPVVGMLQKSGKLVAVVTKDTSMITLSNVIRNNILKGSTIYSDEWKGYNDVYINYKHFTIDHKRKQYANGNVTTNAIENFWSQLKRGVIGIYYQISRRHLQRYVDEFVFKFNTRNMLVSEKLVSAISNCRSRLKYKDLISLLKHG